MKLPAYLSPYIPEHIKMNPVSDFIFEVGDGRSAVNSGGDKGDKTLLLISGMSGGGKTSICNEIIRINGAFEKIKTSTTRPRRSDEDENNDPYNRYTVQGFNKCLENGEILEYTFYADNYYFTRKDSVSSILIAGKNPIVVIDPRGSNFYKQKLTEGDDILSSLRMIRFFVIPPSFEAMKERLILRSGDMQMVERRISQSYEDVEHIYETDYVVINETDRLKDVVSEVLAII